MTVEGNIPDGVYFVNIYKVFEKQSERSPDYTIEFVKQEPKNTVTTEEDDF